MTRIENTPHLVSNFNLFQKLCQTEFGLNFHDKNESVLQTAIETRMQETEINCSQQYFQLLEKNKHEQQEFICLLTINETYFYREQAHLDFLTDVLVPKIQSEKSDKEPIRILSVGCSTGAEPYSIAMALDQKFTSADQSFSIIGSDVDYQVLNFAKQAKYNALTFRALPLELKQRYFVEEENTHNGQEFRLIKKIRDMVSWQYFNIVADPIDSDMPKVDVIFFRNVSIYFDKQTLFKIHQKFAKLLKENAYLIVGLTETLSNNIGPLSLKNEGSIYYFQNTATPSGSLIKSKNTSSNSGKTINDILGSKPLVSPSIRNKPSFTPKKQITQLEKPSSSKPFKKPIKTDSLLTTDKQQNTYFSNFEEIKSLVIEKKYQQALSQIEDYLSEKASLELKKDRAKFLLLRSYISFNAQDFYKAKQDALDVLSLEPFSIDVFLLLGMISKWTQQLDDAISWFKKALYIHPHCWPAHYYLAGLYFEIGNSDKAVQEYRLAIQQLEHPEENFHQLLTIPLTLPKTEIRLLAQTYLQQAELAEKGKRYGS